MAGVEDTHREALRLHRAGRLPEAETLYRQVVGAAAHAAACGGLGVVVYQQGRPAEAEAHLREALRLGAEPFPVFVHLGATVAALGRAEEAVTFYRRALELRPDAADVHNSLGLSLAGLGRSAEAIDCYRRALELRPDAADVHNNLGNALTVLGRHAEAEASYRRTVALMPGVPEGQHNLGFALARLGRHAEAEGYYRRALELRPTYLEAHLNLGNTLYELRRGEEAEACFRRALELRPDAADAHNNLGNVFKDESRLDEALTCYRRALELKPDSFTARSNLLYTLLFHPGPDGRALAEEHRRWVGALADPLRPAARPHPNDRDPGRRLRIGYVSPDFRDHVVGFNLVPLFREHDRRSVEVFCYSGVVRPDALTGQFRAWADGWREVAGRGDDEVAELVRADRIDVLVDLALHLAGGRLPVFARKPAPVQVAFAGYPGTTGLSAIDYRLTDPYLEPPGADEPVGVERPERLPSFWCYAPRGDEPAVGPLPAASGPGVTFGCLNNPCKVNDGVVRLWARVLRAVPDSALLMLCPSAAHRRRVEEVLRGEGIDPARLRTTGPLPRAEYLGLFRRIDVALDTVPYNGHTTSLDGLWMGVPVVSRVGRTVVGRAGLSQLTNLGLGELAADSDDAFVRIATGLAGARDRLAALRAGLRERMRASPLTDAPGFARAVEAAYRKMWVRWCAGE
jgi:predicted O-linked N-acetylglucosamine transferase (SPINDLY family)